MVADGRARRGAAAGAARRIFSGRIATSTLSPAASPSVSATSSASSPATSIVPPPLRHLAQSPRHQIHQPHEVGDHAVGRLRVDLERRAVLLQPPAVDHGDLVGQRQRLGLVVGDVDEGDAGAALQLLELDAHVLAQLGVEIGQRLVEQQDFRLDHQAAGQRDALLLAAGELVGIAASRPVRLTSASVSSTCFFACAAGILRSFRPNTTFSYTVLCGHTA